MLSFLLGIGTGLTVCCKYKEKFMSRSKSIDNMKQLNHHDYTAPVVQAMPPATAPAAVGEAQGFAQAREIILKV